MAERPVFDFDNRRVGMTMSDQSRKKHEKQVERRRKVAAKQRREETKQQQWRAERVYHAVYPEFVFEGDQAPGEFIELVRSAVATINFDDRGVFSEAESSFYRTVREKGARHAVEVFRHAQIGGKGHLEPGPDNWPRKLGEIIFRRIPQDALLRFLPYHDYFVHPHRQQIDVGIRSLIRHDMPGGPFYYSKYQPTLEVNGQAKIVGFHYHVIERVCQRLVPGGWKNYDGMGEAFAYFCQCQEFEIARLYPAQLGFTFYDDCAKDFWSRRIAEQVLGDRYQPDADYSYRVGYCPAFVEGDFVFGITLLFPGYDNTPELGKILALPRSSREKSQLLAEVRNLTIHRFVESNDFSILRWFHEQGVPQVINRKTKYITF
jgi:hypothetical protein